MKGVLEDEAYSYDGVGNRLTDIANNSYAYNNGNELLGYGAGVGQGFSLAKKATLKGCPTKIPLPLREGIKGRGKF